MPDFRNGIFYFLTLGVAGYAIFGYGYLPLGSLVSPDMKSSFVEHPYGIYTHIFASSIALILGPFQFSSKLREKYQTLHRWFGRIYLLCGVLVGGLAGLYISQFAFGNSITKFGFAALAIAWLYTGMRAYLAIRIRSVNDHRKWMIRNFSLTFAAVTLRLYLPASIIAGIDFPIAYAFISWLCWIPNLIFAEWWYIRSDFIKSSESQDI